MSVCTSTGALPFVMTAYNPLPREVTTVVKVPVSQTASQLSVLNAAGQQVPFDVLPSPQYDQGDSPCYT